MGFLGSDGVPTDLYKRFRNKSESGAVAAEALKVGYQPLFEVNEYVHDAEDSDLKGAVVQATGSEPKSGQVRSIVNSFKALRAYADFGALGGSTDEASDSEVVPTDTRGEQSLGTGRQTTSSGVNLSYTINLNLPPTSDIAVFG